MNKSPRSWFRQKARPNLCDFAPWNSVFFVVKIRADKTSSQNCAARMFHVEQFSAQARINLCRHGPRKRSTWNIVVESRPESSCNLLEFAAKFIL